MGIVGTVALIFLGVGLFLLNEWINSAPDDDAWMLGPFDSTKGR